MAISMGKILMAYRPLYLRGLLMDGQYRLPASTPEPAPTGKKVATPSTARHVPAIRTTLKGARA